MATNYNVRVLTGPATLTDADDVIVLDFRTGQPGFTITLPDANAHKGKYYLFVQVGQPGGDNCSPVLSGNDILVNRAGYAQEPHQNPRGVNLVGGSYIISGGDAGWFIAP